MRIKFYFSILVLFLLGLGGALLYLAKGMQLLHLYIVEGIIACILVFLVVFYRKIVKPMNIIGSGMELLREQDFSSRLSKVGQYESDRIVNVFNRMMEQLKNERLRLRIIRKSKFPQNPKRSVRFSGKRTKRSVQKRKARNTQKAETKVL